MDNSVFDKVKDQLENLAQVSFTMNELRGETMRTIRNTVCSLVIDYMTELQKISGKSTFVIVQNDTKRVGRIDICHPVTPAVMLQCGTGYIEQFRVKIQIPDILGYHDEYFLTRRDYSSSGGCVINELHFSHGGRPETSEMRYDLQAAVLVTLMNNYNIEPIMEG